VLLTINWRFSLASHRPADEGQLQEGKTTDVSCLYATLGKKKAEFELSQAEARL
jgi:hypothetical protein